MATGKQSYSTSHNSFIAQFTPVGTHPVGDFAAGGPRKLRGLFAHGVGSYVWKWLLLLTWSSLLGFFSASPALAGFGEPLPLEITPEGVQELAEQSASFLLVNADEPMQRTAAYPDQVRLIYFTTGPSFRAAQEQALHDRNGQRGEKKAATKRSSDKNKQLDPRQSQRLTGTPLDWQRLGLPLSQPVIPNAPLVISPRDLSNAIKDGADLQIIDLRPVLKVSDVSPFPTVLRLLPHEAEAASKSFSKLRWTVLVDDGDGVAQAIAERLFSEEHRLVCVLKGGYRAWVAATDRQ